MDLRLQQQLLAAGLDPNHLPPGTMIGGKTIEELEEAAKAKKKERKKKEPSKTELEWMRHLDWMKRQGVVREYWYEPFALVLDEPDPQTGRPMKYTPDFLVVMASDAIPVNLQPDDCRPRIVEIKGAMVWEDSTVKFRSARDKYGAAFRFSMIQKKQGAWETVLGETWVE